MGDRQRGEIGQALTVVLKAIDKDGAPTRMCTFEARPASATGLTVWIQVLAGSINMQYPFADEPAGRLRTSGAFGTLTPALIAWEPDGYATWDIDGISPADVAFVVDQIFTQVLGCDDATYQPVAAMEDL